jgi:hypothetical protein
MDTLLVDSPIERARVRLNRIDPLLEIARLASDRLIVRAKSQEARQIATECIASFQEVGAVGDEAQACGLLARIESRSGNYKDAVSWARRGLSLAPTIVEPWNRAVLHDNMAVYYHLASYPEEAGAHWLVAVVIRIAARFSTQPSKLSLRSYRSLGRGFAICRVTELLKRPGYEYVEPFLHRMEKSIETIQAMVDDILGDRCGSASGDPSGAPATVDAGYTSRSIWEDEFELPRHPGLQVKDGQPESETRRKREFDDESA